MAPIQSSHLVKICIRQATSADIPVLRDLIEASVRGLQSKDYSPSQIDSARPPFSEWTLNLVADGTDFVAENVGATVPVVQERHRTRSSSAAVAGANAKPFTAATSGQAARRHCPAPRHDAAKIRAFFVHPAWARRGIGRMTLDACESAARAAGFNCFEVGATLTGVPLYQARGYVAVEILEVPLANG